MIISPELTGIFAEKMFLVKIQSPATRQKLSGLVSERAYNVLSVELGLSIRRILFFVR